MKDLKISIVTSCYNAEPYLNETCDSILNQNYKNWEWILIDDFSEDGTKEKISEICSRDDRIKTIQAESKKQYWWNPQYAAIGDVFAHLDSDDRLLPNTFQHINYYFNKFPDLFFVHFYASKYSNALPSNKNEFVDNFVENAYVSTDNDSFLEGFEKLTPWRTDIFGCLRAMRNIPNLHFPVHSDDGACSSNDGQWCLVGEEKGKWMTIPRTVYLIRQRLGSEQFTKWNKRGEVLLIEEAKKRRKEIVLESPRNIKYFDDIYNLTEAIYTSKLNFETESKNISFINFDCDLVKQEKARVLFYDHNITFDEFDNSHYYIINMDLFTSPENVINYINRIKTNSDITIFCGNTH